MATLLEHLPDEVLLIICQYLSQEHIILAFLDLNYRLNCTILQFLQSLVVLEDQYKAKTQSRRILSRIGPYLHSLTIRHTRLSPEEISLASNIQELTFINTQLDSIPVLHNLTDLNIIHGPSFQSIYVLFSTMNNLHSVYISPLSPLSIPLFASPKSSTIKQLAITLQSPKDFIRLLDMVPELTCLNLILHSCTFDEELSFTPHSNLRIFSLRIAYKINVTFQALQIFFKYLTSQLEQLSISIETDDITCLDGQLWQNYLQETFPNLNCLEFFILYRTEQRDNSKTLRLPAILQAFQNDYWSSIAPQNITGYYYSPIYGSQSICIHTNIIPTVQRRRYFLY